MIPRYAQTFPTLTAAEVERIRRFGEVRRYMSGEKLFETGKVSPGMFIVLEGHVAITQHDGMGHIAPVVDQGAGQFLAEVGQLSGRAALVDGMAEGDVETLLIPPDRLRALARRSARARRSSRPCTIFSPVIRRPAFKRMENVMAHEKCTHLDTIQDVKPSALGCEECLKIGSPWVHLRICRTCGHVGCCDSSPHKHATKHYHRTKHPIIEGYDPPEGWGWCYVDEVMFDLSDRMTPQRGPIPRYY